MNPFVPEVLAACTGSAMDLQDIVEGKDPEPFREFFRKDNRHFGRHAEEGLKITDALIESMVHR